MKRKPERTDGTIHARWIEDRIVLSKYTGKGVDVLICSNCQQFMRAVEKKPPFCSWCDAVMGNAKEK